MAHIKNIMNFIFDLTKAVQSSAVLLKLHGNKMYHCNLTTLLYLADRNALEKTNESITGARYVSMKYGPSLLEVTWLITHYDRIDNTCLWKKYISCKKRWLSNIIKWSK